MNTIIKKATYFIILFFSINILANNNQNISNTDLSFNELIDIFKTMSAQFKQYSINNNKKQFESSGTLFITKPDKFRWDILHPNNQVLLSDGNQFIDYDIDLEQASIKSLKNISKKVPIYILSGNSKSIEQNYDIKKLSNKNKKIIYRLTPKNNKITPKKNFNQGQNITAVDMAFSNNALSSIELFSNNKLITTIAFYKVKLNKNISLKKFKLFIPKDVEILK